MLLDKSKIDANVDKTGPVVWIETPASEITVICIIKGNSIIFDSNYRVYQSE